MNNSSDSHAAEKRVTFSSVATNIIIRSDAPTTSPLAIDRLKELRARRATPHKIVSSHAGAEIGAVKTHRDMTPPCRLVESGAVRVQIQTNPRKGGINHDSNRLIDSGAMRLTRHTTPRRLYARRGMIWSPPPSTSKRLAPLRDEQIIMTDRYNIATTTTTPSKKSNAHIGGHRFRAAISPKYTSPIMHNVMHNAISCKENDEKGNIGLELDSMTSKRKLF